MLAHEDDICPHQLTDAGVVNLHKYKVCQKNCVFFSQAFAYRPNWTLRTTARDVFSRPLKVSNFLTIITLYIVSHYNLKGLLPCELNSFTGLLPC